MAINDISTSNQCCGSRFRFEYEDLRSLRPNVSIRPIGIRGILILYVKDGKLYYSVSFDCGKTFSEPIVLFELGGTLVSIQIDSRERDVVVGLLISDNQSNQSVKKAATGEITEDGKLYLRECTKQPITDNPLSVSVGFRPWVNPETNKSDGIESVDYVCQIVGSDDEGEDKGKDHGPWIRLDCHGHM